MLVCNGTVLRNQSTSFQIPFAKLCVVRERDRRRAQIAHQRRRAQSNGCPPSALLLGAASAGDCGMRFSMDAPPTLVRWRPEKSLLGWCGRSPCDRAVESVPGLPCAKVSADHSEAGGTAIHLVDLHDMIDLSEAFAALAEQASLVGERLFLAIGLRWGLLTVELHFIVYLCFGREQLRREIERNTRLGFCLIKGEPLA